MTKLIGSKKVKTAVFISGTGSNLKNLIKFSKNKKSPISIDLILSNSKKAKGFLHDPNQSAFQPEVRRAGKQIWSRPSWTPHRRQ